MKRLKRSREGIWHYYRRVPKWARGVDSRTFVDKTLRTRDEALAQKRALHVEELEEARWRALLKGTDADAVARYEAALQLAVLEGFSFKHAEELLEGPVEPLLQRIEGLEGREDNATVAAAVLGTVGKPPMTLARARDAYYEHTRTDRRNQSTDQARRWRAPRDKAVANFIRVVGDKPVQEITREDAIAFRNWWAGRIDKGMTPNSANKDIGHISQIIDVIGAVYQLGVQRQFAGLRFSEDRRGRRPAFESAWILDTLIPGLSGLDTDERLAVLALVETGLRPVELLWLDRQTIDLAHNVPHVKVRPEGRVLKTDYSERDVPLVGCSLEALRESPDGFPRYRDRSTQFSDRVNHYLRANKLVPSDRHTLYSLRHAFQDRLNDAEIIDRIQDELIGHRIQGPVYGRGPTLEHKQQVLLRTGVTTRSR